MTSILLDVFEDQLDIGRLTLMSEAASLLDAQLRGLSRAILRHGGNVSHADAERHAKAEYKRFDDQRRTERTEQTLRELAELKGVDRAMRKVRRSPKKT